MRKCSTPGSVAQKKAYFEAHNEKIAARSAQPLEAEKQMGVDQLRLHEASNGDLVGNVHGHNAEFDPSNFERTTEATDAMALAKAVTKPIHLIESLTYGAVTTLYIILNNS
uniref:Uncharacterized protein n=1 Tax=Nelumbo nucifera TaxID=4432 RepID=A0A822YYN1_NELNU|nr:TPA_asm: hypothetical protein HUJ06_005008 [Nelumbo nucifera]